MFQQATQFRDKNTYIAKDYNEFKKLLNKGGFIKCGWDGNLDSENAIKSETKATIRCIPNNSSSSKGKCMYSGKPSNQRVIFAKAY